jgi:hypothetical protein
MSSYIDDLLFLLAVIFPVLVIFWSIKFHAAGNEGETGGLLAMKKSVEPPN